MQSIHSSWSLESDIPSTVKLEDPERWKEVFHSIECRELLEENLDVVHCATKLRLPNVITRPDLELVERCATSTQACVKLLDLLVMREDSWRELLNYLEENNQNNVVRDLEKLYQNDQLVKDNRIIYYQTPEGLPIPKQWNVPPRNPYYFTGRDQLLEQLASSLKPSQANATVISAYQGLGGVGKTQLTIEFVHRHKDDYSYTFWFVAEDPSQIETDYSRLAYDLGIDTQQPLNAIVAGVKAWLDGHAGGLLVYDNASNPQALKDYLPTTGTSSILVTSRNTQWHWLGKSIAVDVFTNDEARVYFQELLGNPFEWSTLEALAETLGYLPLALAQAGAYMKETKIPPSRYLMLYEKDKMRVLADKTIPRFHDEPVLITWDMTMQEIQKKSKLALALLTLCACLHNMDIPEFLLNEWANSEANNPDQEVFEEALGTLAGYSMLTMNQERESVSIHCFVQEVIRFKWTVEKRQQILKSAIDLTRDCSPNQYDTREDFIKTQRLLPHSEVLLGYLDEWTASFESSDFISTLLKILSVLTDEYTIAGNDQKRRKVLERLLVIEEQHYGADRPEVASTLRHLSDTYGCLGQYVKQRELLERALSIQEKHYGPNHLEVAITLNNLGCAYGYLGQYVKQRELIERALPIQENHYGPDHPEVANTLNNLGCAYWNLGQYFKAQELLERGLPIKEKHYGPDHPEVATTLNNLGNSYWNLGQYVKARELLERALTIRENHYGPDHPRVATTLNNLGCAYWKLGQHVKARELLEQALPIEEKLYGPDHPEVAITLSNLGRQKQCILL